MVSPTFGCRVCYDAVNSDVSTFRNRIIGLDHVIESISNRGRRLGFSEIENVAVGYVASLIPHEHLAGKYLLLRTGGSVLVVDVVLVQLKKEMHSDVQKKNVLARAPLQGTSLVLEQWIEML